MSVAPTPNKAGNYAVATGKARPWLSTPIVAPQSKIRRTKNAPVIKNPIFAECAKLTSDPFWISLFNQGSLNKFPRGFMFSEMQLMYKRGTRTTRIEISESPVEAMSAIMAFLGTTAGIMSESDQQRAKKFLDAQNSNILSIKNCSWSQIKKDKVKEMLISTFVREVAQMFTLNSTEKKQLETTIHIGFFLGYFQTKHVIFTRGRIVAIDGLNFDTATRSFIIDSSLTPKAKKSSSSKKNNDDKIKEKKSFMSQWSKFLERFSKSGPSPTIHISPAPDIDDVDVTSPVSS